MSADWKPGDLAVCVDAAAWSHTAGIAPQYLVQGATYSVIGTTPVTYWSGGICDAGLILAEVPNPLNLEADWPASRFRKVTPDQHEPCEAEFITLLNRTKRKVGA